MPIIWCYIPDCEAQEVDKSRLHNMWINESYEIDMEDPFVVFDIIEYHLWKENKENKENEVE